MGLQRLAHSWSRLARKAAQARASGVSSWRALAVSPRRQPLLDIQLVVGFDGAVY